MDLNLNCKGVFVESASPHNIYVELTKIDKSAILNLLENDIEIDEIISQIGMPDIVECDPDGAAECIDSNILIDELINRGYKIEKED